MSGNAAPLHNPRVIVALDYASAEPALALAARLDPKACRVKVGKELFTVAGPSLVTQLAARGFDVFLDLKYHDIPNTVAAACKAAAGLGAWMINVHASGGSAMMRAAREALAVTSKPPLLIAVTVLTSMGDEDLREIGQRESAPQLVRKACGAEFKLVTPGIRLADAGKDDQKRIVTPAAAVAAGADYLVVGRPITQAADPLAALARINAEIGA
jgi:orotidine-5'-phosphate decarboxylase